MKKSLWLLIARSRSRRMAMTMMRSLCLLSLLRSSQHRSRRMAMTIVRSLCLLSLLRSSQHSRSLRKLLSKSSLNLNSKRTSARVTSARSVNTKRRRKLVPNRPALLALVE